MLAIGGTIRRQLMIKPGQLFRRSLVMRSQREIFSLGYFEDVAINYQPADTLGNIRTQDAWRAAIGLTYNAERMHA